MFAGRIYLVSLVADKAFKDRKENDLEIKPHRPVLDVLKVVLNPAFHFVQSVGFSAAAVDLRPACDARFYFVALKIKFHFVFVKITFDFARLHLVHRDRPSAGFECAAEKRRPRSAIFFLIRCFSRIPLCSRWFNFGIGH
jgi:hypothetical protein